jgi:Cu2+-containing amine oxidase
VQGNLSKAGIRLELRRGFDNGHRFAAPRTADVVMLDGKQVMEAVVDLQNKKILSWTPIKG